LKKHYENIKQACQIHVNQHAKWHPPQTDVIVISCKEKLLPMTPYQYLANTFQKMLPTQ